MRSSKHRVSLHCGCRLAAAAAATAAAATAVTCIPDPACRLATLLLHQLLLLVGVTMASALPKFTLRLTPTTREAPLSSVVALINHFLHTPPHLST